VLRPVVQETIGDLTEIFASFPKSFMAEGREFHEQRERDWGCVGLASAATAPATPSASNALNDQAQG